MARHDNHEATDSGWMSPRAALARFRAGEIMLAPPQLMSLIELAAHESVDAAMHPDAVRWPRRIDPRPFEHEGTRAVAYPGEGEWRTFRNEEDGRLFAFRPGEGPLYALGDGAQFAPVCAVERATAADEALVIVRHPDGGFRRFTVLKNGRGLAAAAARDISCDARARRVHARRRSGRIAGCLSGRPAAPRGLISDAALRSLS